MCRVILQWGSSMECLTLGNIKYCLKSAEACCPLLWAFDGDEKQYIARGFLLGCISEDTGGFQSCEFTQSCFVSVELFQRNNVNLEKSGHPEVSPDNF